MKKSLESQFKTRTLNEIYSIFPECIILHLDPNDIQGIPDILILYQDKWAALEFKRNMNANIRPNQKYYINLFNEMSYASFIYPENKEEVIHELQTAFQC